MTDSHSAAPAGADFSPFESPAGGYRIEAYLTSVEQVLRTAAVPAAECVQILDDLETQITEMLGSAPLPISDATVADVIARLEPASHFATMYDGRTQAAPAGASQTDAPRYSPWVLAAAGSCATLVLSCLLLCFSIAGRAEPWTVMVILLLMVASAIALPPALHKGLSQLRSAPDKFHGWPLATATALTYWTVVPLSLLLFACLFTEGVILMPVGFAAIAYIHYRLLRRLHQKLTDNEQVPSASSPAPTSRWRFRHFSQPASC